MNEVGFLTIPKKVLVALRNCLLLCFDFLQNFSLHFPYANHSEKASHMDTLHCDDPYRPCWSSIHVPDATAMQAAVLFLDPFGL